MGNPSADAEHSKRDKDEKKKHKAKRHKSPSGAGKTKGLQDASDILEAALAETVVSQQPLYPSNMPPALRHQPGYGGVSAAAPQQPPTQLVPPPQLIPPSEAAPAPEKFRIYIGNINYGATEADVREAFSRFGPIHSISMRFDPEKGHHRGFAFIDYEDRKAVETLYALPRGAISFGGMPTRIDRPVRPGEAGPGVDDSTKVGEVPPDFTPIDVPVKKHTVAPVAKPNLAAQIAAARGLRDAPAGAPTRNAAGAPLTPADDVPTAIVIQGMVRTAEEVDADLIEDIKRECSKFGRVLDVNFYIADEKEGPNVAVDFASLESAKACSARMHGRLFDGHPLRSSILSREYYQQVRA